MEFVTYESIFRECNIAVIGEMAFSFMVSENMIISGENRLSYITIQKMGEAFREFHWKAVSNDEADSICKRTESRFFYPICLGMSINVYLNITNVSRRGYGLRIVFVYGDMTVAELVLDIVTVFYDLKSIEMDERIYKKLLRQHRCR